MKKIAVFASGSGTNFQAIIDAIKEGALEAQIEILICDRKGAKCIQRAESAGIPTFVFSAKEHISTFILSEKLNQISMFPFLYTKETFRVLKLNRYQSI